MTKMYRKHGDDFVVDVEHVWPMIPINDQEYQQWLAQGNVPIEQFDNVDQTKENHG